MPFNPKPDGALQFGKGGLPGLDVFGATMFNSCCTRGKPDFDTLVNPLGADNGLSHTTPTGCRDLGEFGHRQQQSENQIIADYLNERDPTTGDPLGVGRIVYLLRLPSFAQITSFTASVYELQPGFTIQIVGRNGLPLPTTGKKIVVPLEGCNQKNFVETTAALTALDALAAPASTSQSEHFIFMGGSINTLMGNSNDIGFKVVTMPTSGRVGFDNKVVLTVAYDLPLFLEK